MLIVLSALAFSFLFAAMVCFWSILMALSTRILSFLLAFLFIFNYCIRFIDNLKDLVDNLICSWSSTIF